jgi:hypothetical protein
MFRFPYFLFRFSRPALPARVRFQLWLWKGIVVMAVFEQMRANVGKLLKGIDRSELGVGQRSGQAG